MRCDQRRDMLGPLPLPVLTVRSYGERVGVRGDHPSRIRLPLTPTLIGVNITHLPVAVVLFEHLQSYRGAVQIEIFNIVDGVNESAAEKPHKCPDRPL